MFVLISNHQVKLGMLCEFVLDSELDLGLSSFGYLNVLLSVFVNILGQARST